MSLFKIDTVGATDDPADNQLWLQQAKDDDDDDNEDDNDLASTSSANDEESDENDSDNEAETPSDFNDYGGLPPPSVDIFEILRNPVLSSTPLLTEPKSVVESKEVRDLKNFCKSLGWIWVDKGLPIKPNERIQRKLQRNAKLDFEPIHKGHGKTDVAKEMERSVLKNIEQLEAVPKLTDKKAAKLRKAEREKTKGKDWFGLPATEITDELSKDLEIIQMRSALDPKHFYKKNDMKTLPKYFQVGTVLPSSLDRRPEPGVRPSKKRSLVDELLADADFQQFNKRKYSEAMAEKSKTGYKRAFKHRKKGRN